MRPCAQQWAERFEAHDVMYAPVNTIEDVTREPQVNAQEMIVEVTHPLAGRHNLVGSPVHRQGRPHGRPPVDRLGLTADEIED